MKKLLLIDFETRSRVDLSDSGQHVYATHDSTEVLCIGWKMIGSNEPAGVVTREQIQTSAPFEFLRAVNEAEGFVAHNAAFEQAVWNHTLMRTPLGKYLGETIPAQWLCTLSMCSILSLPRSLEDAGKALSLPIQKDMDGRALLLKMCKPRRLTANQKQRGENEWHETPEMFSRLYEYCKKDIEAEELLFFELMKNKPFVQSERDLWVLDQKINQRGFAIDTKLVERCLELIKAEEQELNGELRELTVGWVGTTKEVANMKSYLQSQGLSLENLQKKTVDDTIASIESDPTKSDAKRVLEIRQNLGMSSTSKFEAFKNRVSSDNRVRDNLLFHGASTGRWAGTGVQPQNFPRGSVKITPQTLQDIHTCDNDMLRILYKKPMELFSSALRSVIVPSPGHELFCADFASIEARVLLWLAGDKQGLVEYENGADTYISMASTIFGEPYEKIKNEYDTEGFSQKRQLGKTVILACGYQMGVEKFLQTCRDQRLEISESLATRAHKAFREKYPSIPRLWSYYEQAAFAAMTGKKAVTVGKVTFYVEKDFMFIELPSGRRLAYHKPFVEWETSPFGKERPRLFYWGVNSQTKKYSKISLYGGKITENIDQAISRDCMANALVNCERFKYKCLITIHDENLTEREIGQGSIKEFSKIMSMRPAWGADIPLKVSAWSGDRYRK